MKCLGRPIEHAPSLLGPNRRKAIKGQHDKQLHEQDAEAQHVISQSQLRLAPAAVRRVLKGKGELGAEMVLGDGEATAEAVLVEAVVCPRAREADAAPVLDVAELTLRAKGGGRVERVRVEEAALDGGGARPLERVEGDEDVAKGLPGDVLQDVHVVRQRHLVNVGPARGRGGDGEVVPGGPGALVAGHKVGVGVQDGLVLGGLEAGEDGALLFGGRGAEHGEGLVAVGGEDDVVKDLGAAVFEAQEDAAVGAVGDLADGGVEMQMVRGEALHDGVDVGLGALLDGEPGGAGGDGGQQMVVPEEADEGNGREIEAALVRAGAPYGGGHGEEVVVAKGVGVPFAG